MCPSQLYAHDVYTFLEIIDQAAESRKVSEWQTCRDELHRLRIPRRLIPYVISWVRSAVRAHAHRRIIFREDQAAIQTVARQIIECLENRKKERKELKVIG